jgi:hypothetical protein
VVLSLRAAQRQLFDVIVTLAAAKGHQRQLLDGAAPIAV